MCVCARVCLIECRILPYRPSLANSEGHCPPTSLCGGFYNIEMETFVAILQKKWKLNSSRALVSHPAGRKVTPLVWDWCSKSDRRHLLLLSPEGAPGEPSFTPQRKCFDILCTLLWLFSSVYLCVLQARACLISVAWRSNIALKGKQYVHSCVRTTWTCLTCVSHSGWGSVLC